MVSHVSVLIAVDSHPLANPSGCPLGVQYCMHMQPVTSSCHQQYSQAVAGERLQELTNAEQHHFELDVFLWMLSCHYGVTFTEEPVFGL